MYNVIQITQREILSGSAFAFVGINKYIPNCWVTISYGTVLFITLPSENFHVHETRMLIASIDIRKESIQNGI
jgi:hypothetical protein